MKKNNIPNIFKTFAKDENTYHLIKLETGPHSSVSAGMAQLGECHVLESPDNAKECMILVGRGFIDILKTSPVKEIIKQTKTSIVFKTESDSIYQLSK